MKDTPYRRDQAEHEELLMRLWQATFPGETLSSRVSEQWKRLGFQGTDPATDFRGMGLLGLHNLCYFAERSSSASPSWSTFSQIVNSQVRRTLQEKDYPTAVVGINITGILVDLFHIQDFGIFFAMLQLQLFSFFSFITRRYCKPRVRPCGIANLIVISWTSLFCTV
jgi:hypothetical protein